MEDISTARRPIPLVDLKAQRDTIASEVEAAIAGVLDRCDFILGEEQKANLRNIAMSPMESGSAAALKRFISSAVRWGLGRATRSSFRP